MILKANYLDDFYQKVAQIPTKIFRKNSCTHGLRFNSAGYDIGGHDDHDSKHKKQSTKDSMISNTSNQWVLKRQSAMTSTHKPVNIISFILDKHLRKN